MSPASSLPSFLTTPLLGPLAMPGASLFVEGHPLLTLPAVGLQGRRGGREARAGGRTPTGTQAERKARRRAPALGDARASNSSSSKGQWGHSHLWGPPKDILQPPGRCRKSPALLYVMEALLNWSAGGNTYTRSANTHERTDPTSKHATNIHVHPCACTHVHTHTYTHTYSRLLEDTSISWTS